MTSAKTAVSSRRSTSARPRRPRGSAKPRLTTVHPGARPRVTALSEACTDTGVQPGDEEIGYKRRQHVEARGDQHGAAHQGIVARVNSIIDELPDAGPCKHDLRENRPR